MLVPEIALTPAVAGDLPVDVRRSCRHSAQRPVRRRASRSVAADPPRRRRRRRRHALSGLCAGPLARTDRRRRGARRVVQAGRESALSRARRRGRPRQPGRRARRARARRLRRWRRFHNAQNGRYELLTLARRVLDRPMAAVRIVDMREEYAAAGPDVILSGAAVRRRHRPARASGAVDRPAQPARLRDQRVLPAVRRHARVSRTAACR